MLTFDEQSSPETMFSPIWDFLHFLITPQSLAADLFFNIQANLGVARPGVNIDNNKTYPRFESECRRASREDDQ